MFSKSRDRGIHGSSIGELSGGQQRRIFLARALAQKPDMYFLDEPFVGVDVASEEKIIAILKELRDNGKTVVVVHHDLSKASDYFDELILLNKELIEYGIVEKVFQPEVMRRAYNNPFHSITNMEIKLCINFIEEIIEYEFLQKALTTSIMVGIICGVIGCFIILRGMALMGDAISHAVLPGVALSYMIGINFFFGAVFTGVLTALGIGFISQNSRIKNDVSIGIMFTAAFASGIILITFMKSSTDLYRILFGNVLAVRPEEMVTTLIIGVIVLASIYLFYKELLVSSFDPTMAKAYGLPVRVIHYFLMILLTLVTVASLQTVGIILVVAMLITPASTAYLFAKNSLWVMLYLSAGIGVLSSILGLYFSYTYNLASGATIVLAATMLFILAFIFSPKQGLLWVQIKVFSKRETYLS